MCQAWCSEHLPTALPSRHHTAQHKPQYTTDPNRRCTIQKHLGALLRLQHFDLYRQVIVGQLQRLILGHGSLMGFGDLIDLLLHFFDVLPQFVLLLNILLRGHGAVGTGSCCCGLGCWR